jgi:hypothetical protein
MWRRTVKQGAKRFEKKYGFTHKKKSKPIVKKAVLPMYPLLHIVLYGSKKKECEFLQEIDGRRLMNVFYEYFHGLDQYDIDDWSCGPLPFNDFSIWLRPKKSDHPIKMDMAAVKKFIKGHTCIKTYKIELHTSEVDTIKL